MSEIKFSACKQLQTETYFRIKKHASIIVIIRARKLTLYFNFYLFWNVVGDAFLA